MKLTIETVAYHRNGVCGAPFHAILFRDPDEGPMLGVVFDAPHHVAAFHRDKLAQATVAFGVNSWRGDRYEPALRAAVREHLGDKAGPVEEDPPEPSNADIHRLLASRRRVAIVWDTGDVREVRPDLTDDQAWQVLERVVRTHDANLGISWDVLDAVAEHLFPERLGPGDPADGGRP